MSESAGDCREGWADMHAHLLVGLDDGPQEEEEALAMARQMMEEGISTVVAAPHTLDGMYLNRADEVEEATRNLQSQLEKEGVSLRLVPATETHLTSDPLQALRRGDALTVGGWGRHLCLELPRLQLPLHTSEVLFRLNSEEVTPILIHPERNREIQREPAHMREMRRLGSLSLLSLPSLMGKFGKQTQRVAVELLKEGHYDLVGSDAHGARRRRCHFRRGVKRIREILGDAETSRIVEENPQEVLR